MSFLKNRATSYLILMSICFSCTQQQAKDDCDIDAVEKVRQEIQKVLKGWSKAFNDKNVEEATEVYSSDVVGSYQGEPDMRFQDLRYVFRKAFEDPKETHHYDYVLEDIEVCGNLAVAWITWTLDETHDGVSTTLNERGMEIFKKQHDGTWKIIRFSMYPMIQHERNYGIFHD